MYLVSARYMRVPFLAKNIKGHVRVWTSGWSIPVQDFVGCPLSSQFSAREIDLRRIKTYSRPPAVEL